MDLSSSVLIQPNREVRVDVMTQYDSAMAMIMKEGEDRRDRTTIGTRAHIQLPQMVFPLERVGRNEFGPFALPTRRKAAFKVVAGELAGFLRGFTNICDFHRFGVHIWDANAHAAFWKARASSWGDLGNIYGHQWRHWVGPNGEIVDQLERIINNLRKDPYSRRHVMVTWNPADVALENMALEPCHGVMVQYFVWRRKVWLKMYQRSADWFLGEAFNIPSYLQKVILIAHAAGYEPGGIMIVVGDAHIYHNHFDAVEQYFRQESCLLPTISFPHGIPGIDEFEPSSVRLINYESGPRIDAPMAVGDRKMIISILVARDKNGVIGQGDGKLPWPRISGDMRHFVRVTKGRPESANIVIMGRKTREMVVRTLGQDLDGRTTIVITGQPDYAVPDGVYRAQSLTDALLIARRLARDVTVDETVDIEVVVAGGETIYSQALERADRVYETVVEGNFEGDKKFPELDESDWKEILRSENFPPENGVPGYYWRVVDRKESNWPAPPPERR